MIATWEYHTNPKQYNCNEQHKRLKGERLESFKNRNGCNGRKTDKPRQTIGGIKFHSCYCNFLSVSFNSYMFLYEQYNKGFLPFQGSVLEQPNKAMEIIQIMSGLMADRKAKLEKEANNGRD